MLDLLRDLGGVVNILKIVIGTILEHINWYIFTIFAIMQLYNAKINDPHFFDTN